MSAEETAVADEKKLSTQLAARGIEAHTWNTLKNSVFPGAAVASILMAVDYCIARKLDVLKKPCHIVPMQVKYGKDYVWRDVILPGIYEYRITAQRTGLYLGHTKPEYGPLVGGEESVQAPEFCDMTFYRFNVAAREKVPFPVRVYFREVVGLTKEGDVNSRWSKAPIQMLTKCTEAAGLREAFPDEIGGEPTMEEMIGQVIDESGKAAGPIGTRTDQAKERLRALTDGIPGETFAGNPAGTHMVSGGDKEPAKAAIPANQEQKATYQYDVASALQYLRMQKTVDGLKKAFKQIADDYDFSGRDMPIDVEAIYRDLKEDLMLKEAQPK